MTQDTLEICAGDVASVFAAYAAGATGVEMCAALPLGGLTPPESTLGMTRGLDGMYRNVLIRPRPGDFLYSDLEFAQMEADVRSREVAAADGIVTGMLTADGRVDTRRCARLMDLAPCKQYTFHRGFDMVRDPERALEEIIALGFNRILTSGCAPTAEAGIPLLRRLNDRAKGRIIIMAGGGVTPGNITRIKSQTGISAFHASASESIQSRMTFRNMATHMSRESADEYSYSSTSPVRARELGALLGLTPRN